MRDYLGAAWEDPAIRFLISGGNSRIAPVVESARQEGHRHVFGLVDRDFRRSNRDRWGKMDSDLRVFVPTAHEVENYLLDPDALADCSLNTGKRTRAEIEGRLKTRYEELSCWTACRSVLAALRRKFFDGFPPHPGPPAIPTLQAAQRYIIESPWMQSLPTTVQDTLSAPAVRIRLEQAHQEALQQMFTNEWRWGISGKELLRDIRDWVYRGGGGTSAERDSNLARSVAEWQVRNSTAPPEVSELHRALRTRVELPV